MTTSILPGPRVLLVLLVLGALLGVAETAITPLQDASTYVELGNISRHQSAFAASIVIGLVSTYLSLVGYVGLADHCRNASPRLARVTAWLLTLALTSFVGVRMISAVELQAVRDGVPRRTAAHLVDHLFGVPSAAVMFVLFLAGTVIGLLLLGIAVWRADLPKPAAIFLMIFAPMGLATGHLGEIASQVLLVAAMAWIGITIVRRQPKTAALSPTPVDVASTS